MTMTAPGAKTRHLMTPRQKRLWPILILGAFFEGFDDTLINVALPYIKADFSLTTQAAGLMMSIVAVGTMGAFFASRLADSVGRRSVFLWCVYLYSACSLLTAFAPNLEVFVGLQFTARIFLIGCWSVGYIIVCEEFTAERRGRAVGLFQVTAVLGALLIGILLPVVMGVGVGWRALYVVGALPAIPVLLANKRLPETDAYLALRADKLAGIKPVKQDVMVAWRGPHTKYMVVLCLVWFFMYFGIKGSLNFFSTRANDELSWGPNLISVAVLTSTVAGIGILSLNGRLLDRLGRKPAALLIISVGIVLGVATFLTSNTVLILIFNMVSVGFVNSFLIVGSTLTNELFPTEIRGNAMAWTNNVAGRLGQILVPTLIGTLSVVMSLGHSIAIAMAMPVVSLILVAVFIPNSGKPRGPIEVARGGEDVGVEWKGGSDA
jgi:putative MFS transporter